MPDLFSFFQRFRSPPRTGAPVPFATYDAFLHRFTDSPARFRLVCLTVGGCDWGRHARFTEPVVSADGTRLFAWELKWIPPLHEDRDFPRTGWNRREVLVDLVGCTFVASGWEGIRMAPVQVRPRWQLGGKARPCKAFRSPVMGRGDPIDRVTDEAIEYRDYRTPRRTAWAGLTAIHFEKQAVNTNELPVLWANLRTGDHHATVSLPPEPTHPFYARLVAQGMLPLAALERFLATEDECELTVLSTLGDLRLGKLDGDAALRALVDVDPDAPVDLGGLVVERLRPSHRNRDKDSFPPDSWYFTFSTINGKAAETQMLDEVKHWLATLGPAWTHEFRRDWSQFLELRSPALELRLNYSRSEGFGSIGYTANHYRRMLLATYGTDFAPTRSSVIPNATVSSRYGRPPECLLPTPDALHRPQLTLWRDEHGRCGITDEGWLYLWRRDEVAAIEDGVSDEYADRGGPYYEIDIVFHGGARLTLRRGNGSAAQLSEFFESTP
ncbi:hypothetical protein [Pseudoduganella chitinolytica]|uniref:Uncharacterized protein n=1 Tax=Pseudoduganella chitinolytica TaxID=34070 RepID=A0ABY8B5R1_9BURK|nr:hypothetical protein [Pseudoduganella chitinolytica]WEF31275.1 hypothetical protein PX653_17640 [Pseudoduganella chitinolytica]